VYVVAALATAAASWSQAYPSRPLRFIVPFPAGGTPDAHARVLGRQLEAELSQSVVVDNRSGANGIIGAELVARAAPDGYTFLYANQAFIVNALTYRKLPYDVIRDFTPVTLVAKSEGYVLVVHPSVPVTSVKEIIALDRKSVQLAYGTPGLGSPQQLAAELLNQRASTHLVHVPYRGVAPVVTALLGGKEIQLAFIPLTVVEPLIKEGLLKAVAVTSLTRWQVLPNVPTVNESGVPGYRVDGGWLALFAPARTPSAVVDRIQIAVRDSIQAPKLKEFLTAGGFESVGNSPGDFRRFVGEDKQRWAEIVRAVKVELN